MSDLHRKSEYAAKLLVGAAALLAMMMVAFVVLASVMRYLIGAPFAFTEELVGLLFVSMVFAGLPVCTLRDSHLRVSIVPDLLSGRARRLVDRLAYALMIVFYIWFGLLTFENMQMTYALDARTSVGRFLLWPWTALLPISCLLSAVAALIRMVVPFDIDDEPGDDSPPQGPI